MPVYKSYGDCLLLLLCYYLADLEHGFTFGSFEDSPNMASVDVFIKRLGGITLRREPKNSFTR